MWQHWVQENGALMPGLNRKEVMNQLKQPRHNLNKA